jgi:hypothetical protein
LLPSFLLLSDITRKAVWKMVDVVKFRWGTEPFDNGYKCNQPGNMEGEYVPLAEYEKMQKLFKTLFVMVNLGIAKGDFDIHPTSDMGLHLAECEKVLK